MRVTIRCKSCGAYVEPDDVLFTVNGEIIEVEIRMPHTTPEDNSFDDPVVDCDDGYQTYSLVLD